MITVLRDYRKYGALMLPGSLTQKLMGIEQIVNVNTYEFDNLPADAFDLPPAIKALIK